MLKLWENPMLSIDDRLDAAAGEIERLHDQIDAARNALLCEGMQRDELLRVLIGVVIRCEGSGYIGQDGQYLKTVREAIEKVGAGETATTHNAEVTGA